jgi:hypothetical protein
MNRPDMPRVESSFEAPSHLGVSIGLFSSLPKVVVSLIYSSIFCRSFSKVCGSFLAKYYDVGPGQSPLIIASMTISFGTVGA